MTDAADVSLDRRTVLGLAVGAAGTLAGCPNSEPSADESTTPVGADQARDLAERFAPTLYFDADERWFPTDPRAYEQERDGETVVDGFAAFDGYSEAFDDAPPAPAVFYNALTYDDSPLAVVQYWLYSAFDQFTTNFHWHDWEVLHVYVDTDTGDPQLYVASAHSRSVPNNEFLDPESSGHPGILSELGSHSSALSVNESSDRFHRFPGGATVADITNGAIDGLAAIEEIPLAYGLPRDEGGRLPFVVPELDGAPIYDHDRLPNVDRADLVPDALTVRSFADLSSPPGDLPERSIGRVFASGDTSESGTDTGTASDQRADDTVAYDLVPTADLEHIDRFAGPQLSFEFAIPAAVEDVVASHLTAPGVPWDQPRYRNPAADISEPAHRGALADRYDAIGDPAPVNTVVASITEAISSPEAPDGGGVRTQESTVESVALLESDPVAVPTFRGVVALQNVPDGDHQLTVNGAGLAPHAETITVGEDAETPATTGDAATESAAGGLTQAGVAGEIPMVARENATKLAVDPSESDDDLTDLAVEDDFAGRLYEAPLSGPDAVYVHSGGAYTTEVRDADDAVGAVRVRPGDESRIEVNRPRTGKAPLAEYLADVAEETRREVATVLDEGDGGENGQGQGGSGDGGADNAVRGLAQALDAIAEAAGRVAKRADMGDRGGADASLEAVATRLEGASDRLAAARGSLPPGLALAAVNRFDQLERRTEQAKATDKLGKRSSRASD